MQKLEQFTGRNDESPRRMGISMRFIKNHFETSHISTVVGDCHLAVWVVTGPLPVEKGPKGKTCTDGIEPTHHVTVTDGL